MDSLKEIYVPINGYLQDRVHTAFKKKKSLTFIEFSRFFPDQNDKKVPFFPYLAGFPGFFPEPRNIEKMNN